MDIKSKISELPDTSGVYFFKNKDDKILYIGKANSLKDRVSSYFNNIPRHSPKINRMIKEIVDLEYIPTSSEAEALILESKMIKDNRPYYNSQLKDDKSYPYIQITIDQEFPQIFFHRKVKQKEKEDKSLYFGPFVDAAATREAVKLLRKTFRIRGCRKKISERSRICLDYQLGLCSAPCAQMIDQREYQKRVKEACLVLEGKQKKLLFELYQEMKRASYQLDYEKAAKIRDRIKSIEEILSSSGLDSLSLKDRTKYSLRKIKEIEDEQREKGVMAIYDLKEKLDLKTLPERIEAFDISNIQGELAVGSLVVFEKGRPKKEDYRRFRVKRIKAIDDYAMLQEVTERRYQRLLSEGKPLPDLILIDGGKGQLTAVNQILDKLNLKLPLISLAKKEEEIFKLGSDKAIILPPDSASLFLVKKIRDEAHRFAVTYHRRIRDKELRNSKLDLIPGVGKKRKRILLEHFQNLEEIEQASVTEISRLPGFGKKIAEKIKTVLEVRK